MGKIVLTVCIVVALVSSAFAVMSGKVVVYEGKGTGKVVFDGTVHANKGLTCVDCHPSPFQMKTGGDEITMESMNRHKTCGVCHDGIKTFKADDPKNCGKCHQGHK